MREPVKPVFTELLLLMMNAEIVRLTSSKKEELLTTFEHVISYEEAIQKDEWLILRIAADGTFAICSADGNIVIEELLTSDLLELDKDDPFPNGFDDWQETHFEVVTFISENQSALKVLNTVKEFGHGGLFELALDLTNKFEKLHKGRKWEEDTEESWWDTLDKFLTDELY